MGVSRGQRLIDLAASPGVQGRRQVRCRRANELNPRRRGYSAKLAERGGVEERIRTDQEPQRPDANHAIGQGRCSPPTVLGGPSGQSYLGCIFPQTGIPR
jgi:hypothetical protein